LLDRAPGGLTLGAGEEVAALDAVQLPAQPCAHLQRSAMSGIKVGHPEVQVQHLGPLALGPRRRPVLCDPLKFNLHVAVGATQFGPVVICAGLWIGRPAKKLDSASGSGQCG
jgi:hypothetical protein